MHPENLMISIHLNTLLAVLGLCSASTGCRSASVSVSKLQAATPGFHLTKCAPIQVRIVDEGRYNHLLVRRPAMSRDPTATPDAWTGGWIESESASAIMSRDTVGLIPVPMLLASGAHSLIGSTLYLAAGRFISESREKNPADLAALRGVANGKGFEAELKQAVRTELSNNGFDARDNTGRHRTKDSQPTTPGQLDLEIISAGMFSTSSEDALNPDQCFSLDVRVSVTDESGNRAATRISFESNRARFRDWAEQGATRFAASRSEGLRSVAAEIARQIKTACDEQLSPTTSGNNRRGGRDDNGSKHGLDGRAAPRTSIPFFTPNPTPAASDRPMRRGPA